MTLRAIVTQARRVRSLRGQMCIRARSGYARTLMLDFGSFGEREGPSDALRFTHTGAHFAGAVPGRRGVRANASHVGYHERDMAGGR